MMKKLLGIFTILFSLSACNNDESLISLGLDDFSFDVVGRWYAENNTDNPNYEMFGEYVFTADGVIYIDEYRRINGYRRNELRGVYSIDDNSITTGFDFNEGGQSTSSLKVVEALTFSASFHRFSEDYTLTFQRIVGEIAFMVGDTLNISIEAQKNIENYASKHVEIKNYFMNDSAIASVNDDGLLIAKLIGVTYLKVETSIGTAVLKISVSDKENLWNDFSKVLGRDFDDVVKILGNHYVFKSNVVIRYYYDNPYIDSVDVYKQDTRADSIIVSFKENVPIDVIRVYLKQKHFPVDTLGEWYTDNDNYLLSTFSARFYPKERKLIFNAFDPQWDDRSEDCGLSFEELKKKYGRYRSYLPNTSNGKQVTYKNVKNDFVSDITYWLKPNVNMYRITVNIDISNDMLEDYLNRKFLYMTPALPHIKNVQIDGKEFLLWVEVDSDNNHSLRYHFEENERK